MWSPTYPRPAGAGPGVRALAGLDPATTGHDEHSGLSADRESILPPGQGL